MLTSVPLTCCVVHLWTWDFPVCCSLVLPTHLCYNCPCSLSHHPHPHPNKKQPPQLKQKCFLFVDLHVVLYISEPEIFQYAVHLFFLLTSVTIALVLYHTIPIPIPIPTKSSPPSSNNSNRNVSSSCIVYYIMCSGWQMCSTIFFFKISCLRQVYIYIYILLIIKLVENHNF